MEGSSATEKSHDPFSVVHTEQDKTKKTGQDETKKNSS